MTIERSAIEVPHATTATRVALRRVTLDDQAEFVRLSSESLDLHRPWINAPLTRRDFDNYVSRFDGVNSQGLLVCLRESGAIAGFINLNEIIRGSYQRGLLGYGAFAATAGQGYMREGLELAIRLAFDDLGLHRLEADIQPANRPSSRLVEKLGFRREGYSPGFISINGQWMGHDRWALTADTPRQ